MKAPYQAIAERDSLGCVDGKLVLEEQLSWNTSTALLGLDQIFFRRKRGQYFANMNSEEHRDSKTHPAEESSYVTSCAGTDGSCCCWGSAGNYKIMSAKSWTPMILSSDIRLQIQRLLYNSAETATLQAAETTQKPVSKKGGAKTVFPRLLFSSHSYHLITW